MQEQIRQQGTDNSSLGRSRRARDDASVLHLHRRLQPAFDVEQYPRTIRMMTDCFEQQLPIDAVEVAFYIDVEHPVIAPAALPCRAYSIDRRAARSVAIGVGVEHRLKTRL